MRRPFTPAWLAGDPEALALLDDGFRRDDRLDAALAAAAARPIAPAVLAALEARNDGPDDDPRASPARRANLRALCEPGATVVVTGQQMGLFLGPLYTLYKAAAAIVDARALAARSGRPCVPVFWLQTEDHDLEEIDTCAVLTAAGDLTTLRVGAPGSTAAARVPVGARTLGPGIGAALEALATALDDAPFAAEVLALLRRAYRPEVRWSEAFADVLAQLFADEGLLVLDPRDPALAAEATALHLRCLDAVDAIAATLTARSDALEAAGFAAQVHVRPGAPLLFFAPEGADGPRYRLAPAAASAAAATASDAGRRWMLVGHPDGLQLDDATLRARIVAEPRAASTSALLRPLLQDTLLPTVAYVGGPGEIAYFAQLPPLYALLEVPMPVVVPRARFVVVPPRQAQLLDKLGLGALQACGDEAALRATLAAGAVADGFEPATAIDAALRAALDPVFARLGVAMERLDPNLGKTVSRSRGAIDDTVTKLLGRYEAALARRDADATARLARVRAALCPGDAPQERVLGLPGIAAQVGTATLVQAVLAACVPLDGALRELRP